MNDKFLPNRLTFVFKSEDSSSVFYTVSAGFSKPAAPEASKQRKEKTEKILNLEREIRRNTPNLYELAKTLDSAHEINNQNYNPDLNTATESSNIDSNLEIL